MCAPCRPIGFWFVVAAALLTQPASGHGAVIVWEVVPLILCTGCDSTDVTADVTAIGVEAHGAVSNPQGAKIEVTAPAAASASLDTNAEYARATATLTATATGISAASASPGAAPDRIRNDGSITVTAVAGEDQNGASQSIASVINHATQIGLPRVAQADATGTSTVDAAGIRVGGAGAEITNTGSLDVLGRAHARVQAEADSQYNSAMASSYSNATATSVGISAPSGDNRIQNDGAIRVQAVAQDASARAIAQSSVGTSTSYAEAHATANANGIATGAGRDDIKNAGRLTVVADADAVAEARAVASGTGIGYETATVTTNARATGIDAGAGSNDVRNTGVLNVRAVATATALTHGGIGGFSAAFGATATGIKVGDGGSEIYNAGAIDVLAVAAVQSATTGTAIGILGGSGNDTIVNEGTIFTGIVNDPSTLRGAILANQAGAEIADRTRAGVAIRAGGGNDVVTLGNGSKTIGDIELGDGDDRLTLVGSAAVSGRLDAGSGTDALVVEGAGSLGITPTNFEQTVKQGAGTYVVMNLPTMQRIEVREGTLQVNSGYRFADTGTVQTTVYGDGSHGRLAVAWTATLGGTLNVLREPGRYLNGTRYDVVTADAMTGWFADVHLPDPTPLVSFRLNAPRDRVEVEALVNSFTAAASNQGDQRIAQHLDTLMPAASGDLANVLGAFQALPAAGFTRAFASLSPASYDSSTRASVDGAWQYTQSLRRRLEAVRAASTVTGATLPAQPVLLAALDSDAKLLPLLGAYHVAQPQAKNGLWLNGFGAWGDQEATPGFSGFSFGTGGATLGYDHTFREHLTTGLSLGYAHTDVNLGDNEGTGRIQSLSGSLYGSYFTTNAYLEGAASYLHNWYDNERQLVIGAIARTATSQHEADAAAVYLGAGYAFPLGAWGLGPVGALRYVYLAEAGFQETGADALDLQVAHRGTHSLVSELGLRLTGVLPTRYGTWLPEVGAAWSYDFDVDDHMITSAYAGAPNAVFSVQGQPVARNGALARAGLTLAQTNGLSMSLRYTGEFRDNYQSHGVIGEVRVSF